MFARKTPKILWAEAANTAVFILDRSINSHNTQATPFKLFHGRKPRVDFLRVFGCLAKIPEKKRSGWQGKLDPRSKKVVFVGYGQQSSTYRLFDPSLSGVKSVFESREVCFDESRSFDCSICPVDQSSSVDLDFLIGQIAAGNSTDPQVNHGHSIAVAVMPSPGVGLDVDRAQQ